MKGTMYRAACFLFTAVIIISGSITGTFSWRSLNQQALNELQGDYYGNVRLEKMEKLDDGSLTDTPLAGASFLLYTEEGKQIPGRFITGNEGNLSIRLPAGKYYFEEISSPSGYTFDREEDGSIKKKYYFSVYDEKETVVVKAYNIKIKGSLMITKSVRNEDDAPLTDKQKNEEFIFSVAFSKDGTYSYKIDEGPVQTIENGETICLKHGQTAVFEDIDEGISYEVKEKNVKGYALTGTGHAGNITEKGSAATFINTYKSDEMGSLRIKKEVIDNSTDQSADPDKEYNFKINSDEISEEFTLKDGEEKVFTDIPEGTKFVITERDYQDEGYTASVKIYEGTIRGAEELFIPFANIYDPDRQEGQGNLIIRKKLTGDNPDTYRQFKLEILFSDGMTYDYRIDNGQKIQMDKDNTILLKGGQSAAFEGIPSGVTYIVREIDSAGYIPSVEKAEGTICTGVDSSVIFDNRVPEEAKKDALLTVSKKLEGEYPPEDEEREFGFTLRIGEDREERFVLKPNESKDFKIPAGESYEIIEDNYYKQGYSSTIINGIGTAAEGQWIQAEAVNTYVGIEQVYIQGEKIWNHGNNPVEKHPYSIVLYVYADGEKLMERLVCAEDGWKYTIELPKYGEDGKEITYTIDEERIEGYRTEIDGYNIVNTYISGTNEQPEKPVAPKTEDKNDVRPWLGVMAMSIMAMILIWALERKNRIRRRVG